MKKLRPTEEKAIRHASGWEIIGSTAVSAMALIDCIMTTDPNENYEPSQKLARQLEDQLTVLASFCMEYKTLLEMVMAEIPPDMVAIRVKNPMHRPEATEPSDGSEGSVRDGGDYFPF